jgi:cell wall-associated NlpC family hydrolase
MKEQEETFAQITAEFIGKPFSEDGIGPDSYSCVGFCYAFLKRIGKQIDENLWQGKEINVHNFMEWRRKDPKRTIDWMLEIFLQMGMECPVNKKLAGDLIIWAEKNGRLHPGIYTGNGQFMASYRGAGVRTFAVDNDAVRIIYVRRM